MTRHYNTITRSTLNDFSHLTARLATVLAFALLAGACGDDPAEPEPEPPRISPDRDVLVAIYNATDGSNWRRQENWLTDAPVAEWYGVATDAAGRVDRLALPTNGLKGRVPAIIGELSELRHLAIGGNQLTGQVPPELGSATKLDTLFLTNNQLTGSIPGSFLQLDLSAFGFGRNYGLCLPANPAFTQWAAGIPRLDGPGCADEDTRVLHLLYESTNGGGWTNSGGWLSEEPLGDWFGVDTDSIGRVAALILAENGLSGTLPDSLGGLSALRRLDISGNELEGRLPQSLLDINLQNLVYSGTQLCAPQYRRFLQWLGRIAVHEGSGITCSTTQRELLTLFYEATNGAQWQNNLNWVSDVPIELWYGVHTDDNGQVIGLALQSNGLQGSIPPELGLLSSLRALYFGGNWGLSGPLPEELFDLASLEVLDLYRVGLGGPLPAGIAKLTSLEVLELTGTGLGGPIPPELGELANLRYLSLGYNDLIGEIPPELANLTKLEGLGILRNELSGGIPAELGKLTELQGLNLRSSGLTGTIPATIGNLTKLDVLWLSDNELTGPIPPTLGNLNSLNRIMLEGNDLSGPLPDIGAFTELERLWVGNNPGLSGPLPASLVGLGKLSDFQAGGTDLCAPSDPEFLAWLEGVESKWVARCGAPSVYLTQTVQSSRYPVPLLAERPALLRVFVSSPRAAGELMPTVRATFFHGDAEVHAVEIEGGHAPIPTEVDEGSLTRSANADIPGDVLRPGLEMVIEVDPEGTTDPGLAIAARIPQSGRMAVDVRALPDFPLTLVPFVTERNPDRSVLALTSAMARDPHGHPMLQHTRDLLPVSGMDVTRHAPVTISTANGFTVVREVELIRQIESDGPRYWLGIMGPVPDRGLLGVATGVPSWSSFSVPLPRTIAHELGHNLGMWHAPCGGAGGPDPFFPDTNGRIGSWGYDRTNHRLVSPYAADLMSYCRGGWISGYHFSIGLRHRLATEVDSASSSSRAKTRSVMVWGGRDKDGRLFLEPAFIADALPALPPSGRGFRLTGRTDDGEEVFSFNFDMPYVPDADGEQSAFVYAIPVTWSGDLATISLGDGGTSVRLDQDTDSPMTILRDPVTGQVRAILRKGRAAAMEVVGEPGLVAMFSRGIPREAEERRRR
ncbi:MAG: M66 family metalloprotease [Gemmatimonadota bacterium]|nr:M66 family metalloprotease [Gemmatimonadota bacterium]